ncbi:MAG: bacterio-opsin activator domain-containing protein [Halohasta sp.]
MSRGPAGRAVETRELQVTQDVFADPEFKPWRSIAEAYGYRSVAVIPITYEGTLFGVLALYSDVPEAFSPEKQAIIEQLGEIVGHAIAALERKQALMSDAVTELQFEIREVFAADEYPDLVDGEIHLDRVVPIGGDSYLQYGRATAEMIPALHALVAADSSASDLTVLDDDSTEVAFEMHVTEPPVTSVVADAGGSIERATITNNHLRVTAHLPQTVSVREVLDRIRSRNPTVRPIARRQVTRSEDSQQLSTAWTDRLTDRQRASLEAAFFAGFFEWPRNSSGQDLADSMGVSPATFHQHLRAAERKLFGVLFDDASR